MNVAKVTLKDGFSWYDGEPDGFEDRVRTAQRNRNTSLDVVEILEMTEAEYHAIPATSELWRATSGERDE